MTRPGRIKIEQQLLPADLEQTTPLFFQLPIPFKQPPLDASNKPALIALKQRISELTNEDESTRIGGNILGQFAIGLVKGRITTRLTSKPSGLYVLTADGSNIEFPCPEILRTSWSLYESGVGIKYQAAINKLVDVAVEEPLTS